MPYTINYTDFANKGSITIEDSVINTTTSLKIPGKSTTAYGSAIAESFLHILENFAAAAAPSNPVEGQLWYDTTPASEQLQVYNGSNWVPANNITKSATQPSIRQIGDLWVDKNNSQLYLYTDPAGWVLIGPEFSQGLSTGATPKVISGTDDVNYNILQIDISGKPAAIVTTNSFTPKTKIEGFTTLSPGYNLSTADVTGAGVLKYLGRAEKAENLIVGANTVSAANFLRGDAISTSSFALNMRNNAGINFGINSEMNIGIEGNAGLIQHNIAGSSIDFKVKNDGLLKNILRIDSAMRVGINNSAPDETLHVSGNIKLSPVTTDTTSGKLNILGITDSTAINTGSFTTLGGVGVAKSVYIGNNLNVGFIAGDYAGGQIKTEKIVPGTTRSGTIGTSALEFDTMYARKFVGDVEGNVTGTVTGVAGSANKLSSATTFRITGDVATTADKIFTGQGGETIFNTSISTEFIGAKASVAETQVDDEVLINRTRLATGLKKIQVSSLLASVPTMPIGTIVPFGGVSQPDNWLLCDGSEYSTVTYKRLFDVIGLLYKANPTTIIKLTFDSPVNVTAGQAVTQLNNTVTAQVAESVSNSLTISVSNVSGSFNTTANNFISIDNSSLAQAPTIVASEGTFAVPDLRGRMPLGVDIMSTVTGAANSVAAASVVGASSGNDTQTLGLANLPQHEHDLQNDNGVQYYAVNTNTGTASGGAIAYGSVTGSGTGQALANSGGIATNDSIGQAFDVMNPYLALNYIIYAGAT